MTEQNHYEPGAAELNTEQNDELSTPSIFGYKGRIGRVRYIAYSVLGLFAFYFAMIIPAIFIAISPAIGGLLMFVLLVAFVVLSFSWPIRRLHDLGHSGWLILLQLIPFVNIVFVLYVLFAPGKKGTNQYGAETIPNSTGVIIAACFVPVILIAFIGILAAVSIPAYQGYIEKAEAAALEIQQEQNSLDY
ncbi:MAG: DUF805 domain-containing protein [Saccharospirillaceae bacterium]|nr:DUF805 domain-containing protein [Pseudomonadales bacterium]NRB78566.1 DUF805 domain-containing protein [Saccharospirillaceae bacterium]